MLTDPKPTKRLAIYPKDVEIITGKSLRTSRKMLTRLRKALGRNARDPITYRDFCKFYNWDEDLVKNSLRVSYWLLLFAGLYYWILRDDLDIALLYIVNWVMFKLCWRDIRSAMKYMKNILRSG